MLINGRFEAIGISATELSLDLRISIFQGCQGVLEKRRHIFDGIDAELIAIAVVESPRDVQIARSRGQFIHDIAARRRSGVIVLSLIHI